MWHDNLRTLEGIHLNGLLSLEPVTLALGVYLALVDVPAWFARFLIRLVLNYHAMVVVADH